ncbi:MAG: cytochrome P460 family protein [Pseudomonadota bacterium]
MKPLLTLSALVATCLFGGSLDVAANDSATAGAREMVDVARFDDAGRMHVPADIESWVFAGSSLGMGYSQEEFSPGSPGRFQIVRVEPTAYAVFKRTGRFPDGTMLSLHFFGSANHSSINRAGFVMDQLEFVEIHYKDSARFPDGFNFYTFNPGEKLAQEVSLPNDCVACHKRDGAYDSTFMQFYPELQQYLPHAARSAVEAAVHGHSKPADD